MNPYEVLGLKKDADVKQIRSVYRILSAKHHPDKKGGNREKFEELKLAHDILTDPHRRQRYDRTGRTDASAVTPERVQMVINETIRMVIDAQRPDGSSDDPVWDNIRDKLLLNFTASRAQIRNDRHKLDRKLERCVRLTERFKPQSEYDPIGISLKNERERLESELRINQDAMEMSLEVERVLLTYKYDVGPGSEGHFNPGPTDRRLLSGSQFSRS